MYQGKKLCQKGYQGKNERHQRTKEGRKDAKDECQGREDTKEEEIPKKEECQGGRNGYHLIKDLIKGLIKDLI